MVSASSLPSSSSWRPLVTATAAARRLPPAPALPTAGRGRGTTRGSRRRLLLLAATTTSSLLAPLLLPFLSSPPSSPFQSARAEEDGLQQEEDRVVRIFEETSASVVFIKDLQLVEDPKRRRGSTITGTSPVAGSGGGVDGDEDDDQNVKVEGTGSGFVWDKAGHIVTNYHVVEKLATDRTGLQRCKVFLQGSNGNTLVKEGNLIGFDPAYDLAVLKVNVEEDKLRPALIGTSHDLRVGQSCFAIGNPYGYEHTLTTGGDPFT